MNFDSIQNIGGASLTKASEEMEDYQKIVDIKAKDLDEKTIDKLNNLSDRIIKNRLKINELNKKHLDMLSGKTGTSLEFKTLSEDIQSKVEEERYLYGIYYSLPEEQKSFFELSKAEAFEELKKLTNQKDQQN